MMIQLLSQVTSSVFPINEKAIWETKASNVLPLVIHDSLDNKGSKSRVVHSIDEQIAKNSMDSNAACIGIEECTRCALNQWNSCFVLILLEGLVPKVLSFMVGYVERIGSACSKLLPL